MDAPNLEAVEALDEATRAEGANLSATETPAAGDTGEGSPSEPAGSEELETKEEGNKELETLLADTDLDIDGIKALIDSDKSLKDLLGDRKIEDVLADSGELKGLKEQWNKDDEAKLREEESPGETIARLDQQLADGKKSVADNESARQEKQGATKALASYDANVESMVDATDLPDSHKALMKSLLDSSNPAMSVDIGNKADTAKMVKEMAGKFKEFTDSVIEDYTNGKGDILPLSPSAAASASGEGNKPKTIAEATKGVVAKLLKRK